MKTYPGISMKDFADMDEEQCIGLLSRIELVEKLSNSGRIFAALTAEPPNK